jgi:hypothetical protein
MMKINKDGLNPLYDQYSNDENRLTHALLHTVGSSRRIFTKFLKDIAGVKQPLGQETYEISTQKIPFSHGDRDPNEIESIPDAWIIDGTSKLGVAIEVKDRKNSLRISQLRYHANRIKSYKYPYLLIITPDLREPSKIREVQQKEQKHLKVVWRSWDYIFRWLAGVVMRLPSKNDRDWFLVASMREYLERRREVLGFQGIYFRAGFNVHEAKAILNAEMEELQPAVKRLYKGLTKRRPAITTFSQESVWDCFGREDGFTNDLHITLGINEQAHNIGITVPNSAKKAWARLKFILSNEKNEEELFSILKVLRKDVPHLYVEFAQRHFIAVKKGIKDGFMEFSMDTMGSPFRPKKSKTKEYSIWWDAIKKAILNKTRINGQAAFRARYFLNETKGIDKPEFIKTAEKTIEGFRLLYDFLGKR